MPPISFYYHEAAALLVGIIVIATVLRGAVERKAKDKLKHTNSKAKELKRKTLTGEGEILQLKQEHEKSVNERNQQVVQAENRAKQKKLLSTEDGRGETKEAEFDKRKRDVEHQVDMIKVRQKKSTSFIEAS